MDEPADLEMITIREMLKEEPVQISVEKGIHKETQSPFWSTRSILLAVAAACFVLLVVILIKISGVLELGSGPH